MRLNSLRTRPRRWWCAAPVAVALSSGACRGESFGSLTRGGPAPEGAPNVLLVSLDTLRADHLPIYGYERDTAPGLTALAARGALFTDSRSQTPVTDGTHASLFTGRLPSQHGKYEHTERLGEEETTLAEHLRAHGYRTFSVASSAKFTPRSGFRQGFEDYEVIRDRRQNRRSAEVTDRAIDEMADGDEAPWFGFLHYIDVHAPYAAPEPYRSTWLDGPPVIEPGSTQALIRDQKDSHVEVSAEVRHDLAALYDGEILHLDHQLERLWDAVAQGGRRSTLVILTADHGEGFAEHGYLGHGRYLYEELVRVPLVVWWPGQVAAGTRIDEPVQSVDVFPTVTDLLGLPRPEGLVGRSMAPRLLGTGSVDVGDGTVVMQALGSWGIVRSTPRGRFKLMVTLPERVERLVKVDTDPTGEVDVGARYPEVRDVLFQSLVALGLDDPFARSQRRDDFDDEEVEALRALGYVE